MPTIKKKSKAANKAKKPMKKPVLQPKQPIAPPKVAVTVPKPTKRVDLHKIFNYEIVGWTKPNMQMAKPYYTKVMNGHKHLKGQVVHMSPAAFLKNPYISNPGILEEIGRTAVDLDNLKHKWALPYIDTANARCFGIEKANILKGMGIAEMPVLIVAEPDILKDEVKKYS